ncbi:hypothetical protein CEXT_590491 [Caerostris extrusa]|uniref:Uncharacterized protein n=1 Tax=Caerostris extrusa TaxID=172846 RepID=A0AAV4T6D9_CAEEX|nr:hypothetical protein CEXT_590491 [Caerostris extrusa]
MWEEDISSVQNKKGDLKASKPNSDIKTPTEKTNKQKNVDTIFYYSSYFGNLEEDEETGEKREIFKAKFSENTTCKAVNKKTTFTFDPPEPSSRPSRRVDSRTRQFSPVKIKPETGVKYEKLPPVTQKKTFNQRNRHYFRNKGFQKVTSEVTVEKRINWDPELCKPERHNSRPDFSVKCTSKIDNYYPLHNNSKVEAKINPVINLGTRVA